MNKFVLSISALLAIVVLSGCGAPESADVPQVPDREVANQIPVESAGVISPAQDLCPEACENYVKQCLYLVPNADDYVFDQGRESCLEGCAEWEAEKIECMVEAQTCASMTDICEL